MRKTGSGEHDAKIDVTGYQRIRKIDDLGADNLIKAVVAKAAKDYIRALKNGGHRLKHDCETFFQSVYFYEMTGLNGEAIMDALRRKK